MILQFCWWTWWLDHFNIFDLWILLFNNSFFHFFKDLCCRLQPSPQSSLLKHGSITGDYSIVSVPQISSMHRVRLLLVVCMHQTDRYWFLLIDPFFCNYERVEFLVPYFFEKGLFGLFKKMYFHVRVHSSAESIDF